VSRPIALPFSQRTTAAVAIFACIQIASPEGVARTLTSDAAVIAALQLIYAQLNHVYLILIHQDIPNQHIVLVAAVALAVTIVASLNSTLAALTTSGDARIALTGIQSVVAGALSQINNVKLDEQ
jgi:hypothetical protein